MFLFYFILFLFAVIVPQKSSFVKLLLYLYLFVPNLMLNVPKHFGAEVSPVLVRRYQIKTAQQVRYILNDILTNTSLRQLTWLSDRLLLQDPRLGARLSLQDDGVV